MNIFNIYSSIAGIEFSDLLLLIGFCVGVMEGFFGIGGSRMIRPVLNIFGFCMPYTARTPLASIFEQSLGAVKKHQRKKNRSISNSKVINI